MSVSSVGGQSALMIQSLVRMRAQLDDLSRQLSTGQKSDNYAGLGAGAGLSVSLNSQLANINGYDNTIDNVNTRVSLATQALDRIAAIGSTTKSSLNQINVASSGVTQTAAQATAQSSLDELLGLLNTQAGNRYIFSGKATNQPSVDTLDHILNGNGAQAGLKQLISERTTADLGANGLGRLNVTAPTSTSVAVTQQATVFGLKLASVSSTLTGATVTGPSGSPASFSVDLGGTNPSDGDTLTVRFNLPDGTSENVTLTATTASPPGSNQFTIGTTPAATAANLQTALGVAIGTLASTSLAAASAVTAGNDFFNADANNPPPRVAGPPFDTATAMTAGTTANTVIWYTGDPSNPANARSSATARIDPTLTVSYGTQANEDAIRSVLKNVALLAAASYSPSDPNASAQSAALNQRLSSDLDSSGGVQGVQAIEAQLAGTQQSLSAAKDRHTQTSSMLNDFLQSIVGVSNEDVGAQMLTLQTRLQASLQTTAMLYQTSLVNYLK
ncbi:MAG: flagellar biosynthesis protein FlgL [Pseudolabrys sp.]|nr:flagellar biosynthesis protein FlgL [Pseudolabrys sp.]